MPGIRFDLPNQNPQKGPTCWYYSLKVILRFHNLISPPGAAPGPNLHDKWRRLHHVRQAITQLRREGLDSNDITTIQNRLSGNFHFHRDPHLKQAMSIAGKMGGTTRMNFVQELIGLEYIRQINIAPWDTSGVIEALQKNGPFYISVDKAPHGHGMPKHDPQTGYHVCRVKPGHFTGGAHAMVVFGAWQGVQHRNPQYRSPDLERVYFWNPNNPTTIYYSSFDALSAHLGTPAPFRGNTVGVAVSCDEPHSADCAHITGAAIAIP